MSNEQCELGHCEEQSDAALLQLQLRRFGLGAGTVLALFGLLWLTACGGGTPAPPPTFTMPPPLPTLTPTPLPTPTPTPLPPVELTIYWSPFNSALAPTMVRAELPGLPERDPAASVRAQVIDPLQQLWWESEMTSLGDGTFSASVPLYLPLDPPPGDWRLTVFIYSSVPVNGGRTMLFQPRSVPLWNLGEGVRQGVVLQVPQAFSRTAAEGDVVAGRRTWSGHGGEVGLWWVPGPTEPFTQDTAQVLADATYPEGVTVEQVSVEAVEWAGLPGFRFVERWPDGEGQTLAVQGADRWLYLLRIRATNREPITPLLWDIQASFRLEGQ